MNETSFITTVNIDGVDYTVDELIEIAQQQEQQAAQEEEGTETTQEEETEVASGGYPDVSYVVVNGEKYSIDDEQATTDVRQLELSVATSASIDSDGLISFINRLGETVYTIQLPIYDGSVS